MLRHRKRYPKEVIDCPRCEGTGIDAEGEVVNGQYPDCTACEGTGKQERDYEPEYEPEEDERK